jgi:lipoprotein NlpD
MADRKGIDLRGRIGDSVVAATNGVVVYAGNGLPGYGNLIILEHPGSLLSAYAFNEKILVKERDRIAAGQKIATMGKQGDQPGLHFEIRQSGKPVNPIRFLPKR